MRFISLRKGRKGKALRRMTVGAVLATGMVIPLVGLTATTASALTCPTGYAQGGTSNICVPIYPGNSGSYPASVGTYPFWLTAGTGTNGTESASNVDRGAGSDTTLFMMQQLGLLYNDAGLYGCNLTTNNSDCDNTEGTNVESDSAATDTVDNFDRTEITNGINLIGSGNGLKQLCGTITTPDPVAFARSSKPAVGAVSGCNIAQVGYAKDSVPGVDFQHLAPGLFGSPTAFISGNYESSVPVGGGSGDTATGPAWPSANSGEIGAPAAGWLPGDPVNCVPAGSGLSGTPCSGTPFTDVDNTAQISGDDFSTEAYRLWCQGPNATSTTAETHAATDPRIVDWGELTNLSTGGATTSGALTSGGTVTTLAVNALPQNLNEPLGATSNTVVIQVTSGSHSQLFEVDTASAGATSLTVLGSPTANFSYPSSSAITYAVGDGTPIGVPVHIVGINTGSGTVATFTSFALSGTGDSSDCGSSSYVMDANAAEGADPLTPVGVSGNQEIAVENNPSQIATFAGADFPNDLADQAVAVATSLYGESNGVYLSNPNADTATLLPGTSTPPSGVPLSYSESEMTLNGITDTLAHETTNLFPTSRTLFNAYVTTNVNASVGAFFNWLCDSNTYFQKANDLTFGPNYDNEISNVITNDYEYVRLTDTRTELSNTTPADGISGGAPNAQCDASLASMVSTGSNTLTYEPGGVTTSIPSAAGFPGSQVVDSTTSGFPGSITVSSISGSVMTVSGTIPAGTYNLYFPGMPPVLNVTNLNS